MKQVYDKNQITKDAFPQMTKGFEERIEQTLRALPDEKGGVRTMKKTNKSSMKKWIMIAAAAVMLIGTSAFAAGKVASYVGHGFNIPKYTQLPTKEQMQQDYGFVPKLVEKFSTGYSFDAAYDSDTSAQDEEGNAVETFKNVDFTYKGNEDKEQVTICMNTSWNGTNEVAEEEITEEYQGVALHYSDYSNKCVPPDYKMTEEDKKAEEDGSLVFSVGSPEVSISHVQNVIFTINQVNYDVLYMGEMLTKDDMMTMARELVDAE